MLDIIVLRKRGCFEIVFTTASGDIKAAELCPVQGPRCERKNLRESEKINGSRNNKHCLSGKIKIIGIIYS